MRYRCVFVCVYVLYVCVCVCACVGSCISVGLGGLGLGFSPGPQQGSTLATAILSSHWYLAERKFETNNSYRWNKGAPFVCQCFCVCVFGYREREMCGLWAVMEDPVSLMWWTRHSLHTVNGTHSSTELSSVHLAFMSCRWRYKRRDKGI